MNKIQASIIPGTIGWIEKTRELKNGFIEQRFLYYRSPEWNNKPKIRRVKS